MLIRVFYWLFLIFEFVLVAADTGAIGGSVSHEFHLKSGIGEDTLKVCSHCGQSLNSELLSTNNNSK